jgi:HSP20 family protein
MESQTQIEQGGPGNRGNGQRGIDQSRQGSEAQRAALAQTNQAAREAAAWSARNVERYNHNAFALMEQFTNQMYRIFEAFAFPKPFSRWQGIPEVLTTWSPEVDIRTEQNQVKVCVDLPGLTKDNVKVDVDDGQIAIQGERQEERTDASRDQRFRKTERRYGSFYRAIPLPDGANPEQARANMKEGVLEITVPLSQRVQGRRLEIRPS